MANNEELSQEVKVEETKTVATDNVADKAKVKTTAEKPVEKKAKKTKKAKDKKPNKISKSLKETSSELKKVTWPKFSTVLKQTGVVLLVTAIFLLVVFGIDMLCSWLVDFIV